MLNNFFVTIVITISIISCFQESDNTENANLLSIDSVSISIDSSQMNSYYMFSYNEKTDQLMGYNDLRNTLDFYDLSKYKFINQIKLQNEGPEGVNEILGAYFFSRDSIFLQDASFLKIFNSKGKIVGLYDLNKAITEKANPKRLLATNQYIRLQYIPSRKSIIYFAILPNNDYLTENIFLEYNLQTQKLEELPIKFSEYFIENKGKVGFLLYSNATVVNDTLLIYNHLFSGDIYKYNLKTKVNNTINVANKLIKSIAVPLAASAGENLEKWQIHAIENPHFFQVLYDKYRNVYYRFSWKEIPYMKPDNTFNSFLDKPFILTIFDKDFNLINEIKLPKHIYMPFTWFVTPKGIMISNATPKNPSTDEEHLSFHIIKDTH